MSEVLADAKADPRPARGTGFALRFALLALSVALATAISIAAHETHHPVTGANVFIVAVLVNGAVFGLGQGLATAVVVSVIYDFFIRFTVYERGESGFEEPRICGGDEVARDFLEIDRSVQLARIVE